MRGSKTSGSTQQLLLPFIAATTQGEKHMRKTVLALLLSGGALGLFGLTGLTSASAVPANGAIIGVAAQSLDMKQDIRRYYRVYRYHRYHRHYRYRRW
jgi:hypothetical protein